MRTAKKTTIYCFSIPAYICGCFSLKRYCLV